MARALADSSDRDATFVEYARRIDRIGMCGYTPVPEVGRTCSTCPYPCYVRRSSHRSKFTVTGLNVVCPVLSANSSECFLVVTVFII